MTVPHVTADMYTQDFRLDCNLIFAGHTSRYNTAVMHELTLPDTKSPEDAFLRAHWLKTQPKEYIDSVIEQVGRMVDLANALR